MVLTHVDLIEKLLHYNRACLPFSSPRFSSARLTGMCVCSYGAHERQAGYPLAPVYMYSYESIGFFGSCRLISDFRQPAMCPFLVTFLFSWAIILMDHGMSTCIIYPHAHPNQILPFPGTAKPILDLRLDLDSNPTRYVRTNIPIPQNYMT
jgi:hypothetical protein